MNATRKLADGDPVRRFVAPVKKRPARPGGRRKTAGKMVGRSSCGPRARATGPLEMFDRELIGYVCSKSEELGCGFELHELHVAPLDGADRKKLWDALENVVDPQPGNTPGDLERFRTHLRRTAEDLGIGESFSDAFLLDKAAWRQRHVRHPQQKAVSP